MSDKATDRLVDKLFYNDKEAWPEWSVLFLDAAEGKGDDDHSWAETVPYVQSLAPGAFARHGISEFARLTKGEPQPLASI